MTSRLLQGDARSVLPGLAAGSVHMAVTSPPYWAQRKYAGEADGMIGNEPTPAEWCDNLVVVFRAVRRVLRDDGVLFVNCGDKYAGSGGAGGDYAAGGLKASANGTGPASSTRITVGSKQATHPGSVRPPGLPLAGKAPPGYRPKSLLGLPWMLAFALMRDGWILRQEIIWAKRSPMPESATDRPTRAHEQLFLFSKSNNATFWTHRSLPGVRTRPAPDYRWRQEVGAVELRGAPDGWAFKIEDCQCHGTESRERHWYRDNLWEGHDYYWDATAIRDPHIYGGQREHQPGGWAQDEAGRPGPDGKQHLYGHPDGRNARSVQAFAPSPFSVSKLGKYGPMPEVDHYALFPISLPLWCIRAGTSEKGVCPECGAPWVRQTDTRQEFLSEQPGGQRRGDDSRDPGTRTDVPTQRTRRVDTTTGWAASCAHAGLAPVPATILDPFMGAGTTALAAEQLGRNSIGCELSPAYIQLAEARLHEAAPLLGRGT